VNSKERVRAAIDGKSPDRVPLGLYVVDCDTVERVIGRKTYVRNKIAQRIAFWEGRRQEVVESLKKDTVEFFRKIDCVDLITFKEAPLVPPRDYEPRAPRRIDDETWQDEEGRIFKVSHLSNEIVCVVDPTRKAPEDFSMEMFDGVPDVEPPDASVFEACDHMVQHLGKDRYIAGLSGGITCLTLLGGQETGLMLYALKPQVVRAANRQSTAVQNLLDRHFIRPTQDGVLLEQDMASTKGPLVSPEAFRRNCLPFFRERVDHLKGCGQQVLLHNCGNNLLLMDMFIEAGVQCYQSIQSIPQMDIGLLKQRFGHKLTLWGGVATELLIAGTPVEVRKNVRRAMELAKRGGRFILGPSHSVAFGTRYDNFMAMLEEYDRLADY